MLAPMLDALQLRTEVVRPALHAIGLHTAVAEDLVMGTAAAESSLKYLVQHDGGPALGLFQMEPATHNDIWRNYLLINNRGIEIASRIQGPQAVDRLIYDLRYAAQMCRIHYYRVREPLPSPWAKASGLARYWKQYYNTPLGRGTEHHFYAAYQTVTREATA